jgi:hypothetical protein
MAAQSKMVDFLLFILKKLAKISELRFFNSVNFYLKKKNQNGGQNQDGIG